VGRHDPNRAADDRIFLRQMSESELNSLILRLGRHALKRSGWRSPVSREIAESAVCEAFQLWLEGRRRWNRDKYDDVEAFLQSVVDSILSHGRTSGYTRYTDLVGDERDFDVHRTAASEAVSGLSPEQTLLERERHEEADFLLDAVSKADPVAIETIKWMRAGLEKPQEIAAKAGRPVDEIYLAIRRMKARGAAARRELEQRKSNVIGARIYGDETAG
jgi:hypothetical protein